MAKKVLSRLGAAIVALAMIITTALPAFAAETGSAQVKLSAAATGTIQVTDAADTDSFKAYQVLKVSFDAATNAAKYELSDAFAEYLASGNNKTSVKSLEDYQAVADDSVMQSLMGGFAAYCVNNSKAETASWDGKAEQSVALGQYVITGASTGNQAVVYGVMTASFPVSIDQDGDYVVNSKVSITAKKDQPSIDKEITDKVAGAKDVQVSIGDTVHYEIVTTIPGYPADAINHTYKIGDTLSDGLTGHNELKVYGVTGNSETLLSAPDAYSVTTDDGKDLLLTFVYSAIKGYSEIHVEYASVVTSKAVLGADGNPNTAYLEYSNNPYSNNDSTSKPEDEEKVYTYEIDVTKVDDGSKEGLQGVKFELYKEASMENKIKFSKVEGTQNTYKVDPQGSITTLETGTDGVLKMIGLDVGKYYLKETQAASGYALPATPFEISVVDANKNGLIDDEAEDNAIVDFEAENHKVTTSLPQTGGVGTYVFIIIGLVGMAAAVIAFAAARRKADQ